MGGEETRITSHMADITPGGAQRVGPHHPALEAYLGSAPTTTPARPPQTPCAWRPALPRRGAPGFPSRYAPAPFCCRSGTLPRPARTPSATGSAPFPDRPGGLRSQHG
ncbi:hypothetical protein GCM10009863_16020 [Streptomyces axinellae]|uniref:Uncharacterized protein n=1 Tax=Streptomyces axinellae TaxID=552788 RepID=A0ABN3PUP3_9ACTN